MLGELGVTELEEAVYLALLDRPGAGQADVADACGATEPKVGRALIRLCELGLVTRQAGRTGRYRVVPPELSLDVLVRQREEGLSHIRRAVTELSDRFHAAARADSPGELIEVVSGHDAIHQRWLQLQRSAHAQIRVFDKPPYIDSGNPAEPDLLRNGIRYRTVYDRTSLDVPGKLEGIREALRAGEDSRVGADVPIKLFIADDRMALAPLQRPRDVNGAIIVNPSALLDALISLFEITWSRSVPLREVGEICATDTDGLDESHRRVLQLLAAGYPDEAIGRQLGLGYRTVQRRIGALMELFGVRTRFQLGMQAAHRLDDLPAPRKLPRQGGA